MTLVAMIRSLIRRFNEQGARVVEADVDPNGGLLSRDSLKDTGSVKAVANNLTWLIEKN